MRIPLYLQVVPIYLVIGFMVGAPLFQRHQINTAVTARAQQTKQRFEHASKDVVAAGMPSEIIIEAQKIDVLIKPGRVEDAYGGWSAPDGAARFAVSSDKPSSSVNTTTFIYGHASQGTFLRLNQIKNGETVYLRTEKDHVFRYEAVASYSTTPQELEAIHKSGTTKSRLLIVTAYGLQFNKRYVVLCELKEAV